MSSQPYPVPVPPPSGVVYRMAYKPYATYVLLVTNLVIFLLESLAGGSTNPDVLLQFGASFGPFVHRGEYWRLVMPMFLHIGWLHLLGNSYALYILGPILERIYGYGRFALIYVGAGIGGSYLSIRLSNNIAAGASGAIFGIAGAMLVTGFLHRQSVPPHWGRAFGTGILPFILLNLILGYSIPNIDKWGHIGGLVTGMVLALLIPPPENVLVPGQAHESPSQAVVLIPVATVVLAMVATAGHYQLSRDITHLLEEGIRLRTAHQTDQAMARFQEAARRAPGDERPHEQMASLYMEKKQFDDAIREYNEALRLEPASPEAQLGLGLAYRMKGDLPKARQYIEGVLGKDPRNPALHQLLADLLAQQKIYQDAIVYYQSALRLDPNLASAHNNLAWLYATSEDEKFRNPRGALEHAKIAVQLSQEKEATYLDTLAEAYYVSGNFDEAVRVQTKTLQLDPNNPEYREHMARYRKAASV